MLTVFLGGASNGNWLPLFLFFIAIIAVVVASVKGFQMLIHFIRVKLKKGNEPAG